MAGAMLMMIAGLAALAIDLAHAYMVRNELQNAADASALVGAACLFERSDCGNSGLATPTWDKGKLRAQGFLGNNKAENQALSSATISAGYWNMESRTLTAMPAAMGWVPTSEDVPAVSVTVQKAPGINNGGISTFLAKIFGISGITTQVQAVAISAPPSGVSPGTMIPFVLSKCLYDKYWDSENNAPLKAPFNPPPIVVVDPSNGHTASIDQTYNQPYIFPAVSALSFSDYNCNSGQWTSFNLGTSSAETIRTLVENGNATPLSIGDSTFVAKGKMDTLFSAINACSAAGNRECEYSVVPIVEDASTMGLNSKILAFACVHILSDGKEKDIRYIKLQMMEDNSNCNVSGTPGGVNYGALVPPRLTL